MAYFALAMRYIVGYTHGVRCAVYDGMRIWSAVAVGLAVVFKFANTAVATFKLIRKNRRKSPMFREKETRFFPRAALRKRKKENVEKRVIPRVNL